MQLSRTLLVPLTAALGAMAMSLVAHAAPITWQAPVAETGSASDILTTGTLFRAVTANAGVTVGGVAFSGGTLTGSTLNFGAGSDVTVSSIAYINTTYGFGSVPSGWDSSYKSLITGGGRGFAGSTTITISGLAIGTSYNVQLLQPFWNNDWETTFSAGGNTSAPVEMTGPGQSGSPTTTVPQYVIGSFVADGTTESIVLGSPNTSATFFNAIEVRSTTSVPEPSSLAIGLPAAILLFTIRRRRTARPA